MKTLIFNGSPRKDGDTAALIRAFASALPAAPEIVDAYTIHVTGCLDCRACTTRFHCAVEDDMSSIYRAILASDCIVIASPIYYSLLTGRLLDVLSRLQPGYYARQRGEPGFHTRPRRGGILLAGGGDGSPDPAIRAAKTLLHAMGATSIEPPVASLRTNTLPAAQDKAAIESAKRLARVLSQTEKSIE